MTDYRLTLVETFKVGDILFSKDRFFGAQGPFKDEPFPREVQRFFEATEDDVENYSGKGLQYYKLDINGNCPDSCNYTGDCWASFTADEPCRRTPPSPDWIRARTHLKKGNL